MATPISVTNRNGFIVKSHPSNTVNIFLAPTGTGSGSGFFLAAGEAFPFSGSQLNNLSFGVTSSSGSVCWAKL